MNAYTEKGQLLVINNDKIFKLTSAQVCAVKVYLDSLSEKEPIFINKYSKEEISFFIGTIARTCFGNIDIITREYPNISNENAHMIVELGREYLLIKPDGKLNGEMQNVADHDEEA